MSGLHVLDVSAPGGGYGAKYGLFIISGDDAGAGEGRAEERRAEVGGVDARPSSAGIDNGAARPVLVFDADCPGHATGFKIAVVYDVNTRVVLVGGRMTYMDGDVTGAVESVELERFALPDSVGTNRVWGPAGIESAWENGRITVGTFTCDSADGVVVVRLVLRAI